mmetsp:Transcript_33133/g.98580  ORF Transcript_33133/g.98580 Transcript_33133/m.98580 type:complete len:294 (+) Transcript_33133:139-1020(+)
MVGCPGLSPSYQSAAYTHVYCFQLSQPQQQLSHVSMIRWWSVITPCSIHQLRCEGDGEVRPQRCLGGGGGVALSNLVPVDQLVHKGSQEVRAPVAVVDVVCMLPYVARRDGGLALDERQHRVGRLADGQLARLVGDQPRPPGAELRGAGGLELGLEVVQGAEVAVDGLRKLARRRGRRIGVDGLPEECVVPDLRRVVERGLGRAAVPCVQDDLLQRHVLRGAAGNLLQQVVVVCLVVLAVVVFERLLGERRLERVHGIGQARELERLGHHRRATGSGGLRAARSAGRPRGNLG